MYEKCIKSKATTILTDDKEILWKDPGIQAAFFDYTAVKSAGQNQEHLFYCS